MNRDWPALGRSSVQWLSIAALAVGVGVWGAILLAPTPRAIPPALVVATQPPADTAPVAGWFGAAAAARVKVESSGLIAAGPDSSAILAVDGGRARAYGVGARLASDLTLAEVRPDAVVLRQGAQHVVVEVPRLPEPSGITPAR
ncbi:general secretion pathway protein GspC [Verticiella sediminum]|uniref:General secretion pathway protein GspC n=1 Tax=Verticiella sediminum TaxID=1247510 RepID=A0A556ACP5_9BURK|nr:type II secretion system protein N [Verticiella sediminum]TSH90655.1 general secretion pathway protein GspC [Verticiella sediminum]